MTSGIDHGGSYVLRPKFTEHSKGFSGWFIAWLVGWIAVCRYKVRSENIEVLEHYRMKGKTTHRSSSVTQNSKGICHN